MATDINLSLDDIIKKNRTLRTFNPRKRMGGRNDAAGGRNGNMNGRTNGNKIGGGRQQLQNKRVRTPVRYSPYKRGDVDSPWSHDLYEDDGFNGKRIDYDAGGTKAIITNLDFGVTDSDLEELFIEIGPLVSCEIHYDKSGRSFGSGSVVFEKRTDALRAINQYNGVPLDGRPMKIEIGASAPGRLIGSKRLGVSNNFRNRNTGGGGPMRRRFGNNRGGGGGFGSGNNRSRRNNTANISAEQLDAELEEYRTKGL